MLASLAAARTQQFAAAGVDAQAALNGGYQAAFLAGAIFAGVAGVLGATQLRARPAQVAVEQG